MNCVLCKVQLTIKTFLNLAPKLALFIVTVIHIQRSVRITKDVVPFYKLLKVSY